MEKYVKYVHHESGIHEYVWLDSYRDVIDQYIPLLREMNDSAKPGDTVLVLQDFSMSIAPPFSQLRNRASETRIREDVTYKVAYISGSINRYLLKGFIRTGDFKADRYFFEIDQRETAISWLLKELVYKG